MNAITIDPESCTKCGLCAEVCPNKIIRKNDKQPMTLHAGRIGLCFKCGQCMAACPTQSIRIEGLSYERDFVDLPKNGPAGEAFFDLIASRRSVRNFTDQPVEREALEKIVKAISFAPPAFPPIKFELVVVQKPEIIKQALPYMIDLYAYLAKAMRNPIARWFIKREVGDKRFRIMQKHLLPLLVQRLPALQDGSEDTITRRAPAMILFLADRQSEDIKADVFIAATYGILAAHASGLGGTIMDIIPPTIEKKKELRRMFHVKDDREVVASIILGHPKYKYRRGIIRKIKKVDWL